jgi:hypothetical protein
MSTPRDTHNRRWWGHVHRAIPHVAMLAGLAIAVTACASSSHGPGVAGAGSATTPTASLGSGSSSSGSGVTVAYSECMRSHGVPSFPDPNSQGEISIKASSGSGGNSIDPNSTQYLAAQKACAKLAPSAGSPAQQAHDLAQALKYSACMRSHGVPTFPDPTLSNGQIEFAGPPGIGRTPQFQTAQTACQSLLSGSSGS